MDVYDFVMKSSGSSWPEADVHDSQLSARSDVQARLSKRRQFRVIASFANKG